MNDGAVTENTASNSGGGIYNTGDATLNDVNIEENTAQNSGGGIYADQGSARLRMQGGKIFKNQAGGPSTARGNGGGLRFYGIKGDPDFQYCQCQSYLYNVTITENNAGGSGDGVYIITNAYLNINMCTVIDNGTQDIGLQGKLYLSMPQSKIGKIYCSNTSGSVVQNVGINVHSTFGNNKGGIVDKVDVTLEGYEDGLTLLTINEANQIGGSLDWFKLPDSVTDYKIVANGKEGQLKYIGTSIEDYSNFDHDEQMVKVEGKTFNYDNSTGESSFVDGENTINSFYISKTEITQEVYKSVMSGITITDFYDIEQTLCQNPSLCVQGSAEYALPIDENDQDSRPVDNVTWYDAVYFCNKLSELKGRDPVYTIENIEVGTDDDTEDPYLHIKSATVEIDDTKNGYRLPTRSEWEFAFRGGDPDGEAWDYCYSGKDSASYNSGNDPNLDDIAWYYCNNDDGRSITDGGLVKGDVTGSEVACGTHPVAKKNPNALDLYDMSGNVYEWVEDIHMYDSVTNRILMGGSWFLGATTCSWKDFSYATGGTSYAHYGFRIVCNE
jgi:predicted outer membrane repeat protein